MADITINDLTEITEVTDSHYLAVDDGTASNKITVENFNATATASAAAYASAAADSATAAAESETKAKGYKETVEQAINDASTIVSNAQTYANSAESSKNDASGYASDASTAASQAANSATLAAGYATNVNAYVTEAKSYAEGGTGTRVGEDTDNAKYYSQSAHTSETNAAASESNASTSETNAAASESNAATSESNASGYASSASADALKAEGYAVGKQNGVDVTSGQTYYHDNAKYYKEEAATSASNASTSETNAGLSESAAAGSASAADDSAEDSEAWAVGTRDGDPVPSSDPAYHNNAKYWADVAAGGVSGVSSFNGRSGNVVPSTGDYSADIVSFDNSTNGFTATDTQAAIEEVNTSLGTLDSSLANVAKSGAYSDLSGTPTLGTAAAKDVPVSGNASTTQVVMGDDSRLTDSRTPTSHTHTKSEITDFPSLGTAAAKDSTNAVTQSSTDLVESGAVYSEISSVSSALSNKVDKDAIGDEIETIGSAALYAHNKNGCFYATDGKIYNATDDIAIGDILTVGTNCALSGIIEIISDNNETIHSSKMYVGTEQLVCTVDTTKTLSENLDNMVAELDAYLPTLENGVELQMSAIVFEGRNYNLLGDLTLSKNSSFTGCNGFAMAINPSNGDTFTRLFQMQSSNSALTLTQGVVSTNTTTITNQSANTMTNNPCKFVFKKYKVV